MDDQDGTEEPVVVDGILSELDCIQTIKLEPVEMQDGMDIVADTTTYPQPEHQGDLPDQSDKVTLSRLPEGHVEEGDSEKCSLVKGFFLSDASYHGSRSPTSSLTSNVSQPGPSEEKPEKKRARRRNCVIPRRQEEALVDWVRDQSCLWDSKKSDYRIRAKKERVWQEKSEELGISVARLTTWFKSLRDIFTKLDRGNRGKSGEQGLLTEREIWIKNSFSFLRKTVRHRPGSANKRIETMTAKKKCMPSVAEAEVIWNIDDNDESMSPASIPKHMGRGKRTISAAGEEEALQVLQRRVAESEAALEAMKSSAVQPITSRAAFANYVHDSLLSMSDRHFKRARKEMNRLLTSLMDEEEEDG